jgi:beta-glucosidase
VQNGRHTLKVRNTGMLRLYLDGKLVIENGSLESSFFWGGPENEFELMLQAGQNHSLKIEYIRTQDVVVPSLYVSFGYTPSPAEDRRLEVAVAAAKAADVALVFAGWPEGHESEGLDRPGIGLTNRQDELIAAVAAANPRTVVVLNCGSPVAMPWASQVMGIVEAYYPGQENGNAVADILLGAANPSGKLTVTFPQRIEDTPAYTNFGPGRQVLYGEGVFVGYRHYDQRQLAPLFPFGHGLSYTTFEYSGLVVTAGGDAAGDAQVQVSLKVHNTGTKAGAEVVQLYVSDPASSLPRPPKELKGFARVDLQPGERKLVSFTLDRRAFAFYDVLKKDWVVEPGVFGILVGASSRDIRLSAEVTL